MWGSTLMQQDSHAGKRKVISLQLTGSFPPGPGLGAHFMEELRPPKLPLLASVPETPWATGLFVGCPALLRGGGGYPC